MRRLNPTNLAYGKSCTTCTECTKSRIRQKIGKICSVLAAFVCSVIAGQSVAGQFVAASPVQAQTTLNLSVTPPVAYLKLKPGSSAVHTITVENQGEIALEVQPKVVDFVPDGLTGQPILQNQTSFPHLHPESQQLPPLTLAPRQRAQLSLKFDVPVGAPEQEYPLTVLFEARAAHQPQLSETTASLQGSLGSNLIVLVTGQDQLAKNLRLKDLKARRVLDSFATLTFTPILENLQPHTSLASGSAKIKNWRGQTVAEYKLYPDAVLGFSTREARAQVAPAQAPTLDAAQPAITPGGFTYAAPFVLGPYTIEITLDQGENQPPQTIRATIVALPLVVLALLVVGTGIIVGYNFIQKSRLRSL